MAALFPAMAADRRRYKRSMTPTTDGRIDTVPTAIIPKSASAARTTERFTRLHLGCGPLLARGFLNVDESFGPLDAQLAPGVAYRVGDAQDDAWILKHDLRNGMPAAAGTLELIYHAHLLEHLPREDGVGFLRQCFACLRDGAMMRIALPDLALWSRNYAQGNDAFFHWYRQTYLGNDNPLYQTNAQVFMGMLYNHGHRMAYDFPTLSLVLAQCGFTNIIERRWGESDRIDEIAHLESTEPGMASERRHESLVLECEKPAVFRVDD